MSDSLRSHLSTPYNILSQLLYESGDPTATSLSGEFPARDKMLQFFHPSEGKSE